MTFGLAAKDLISNFIGGAMLAVLRPFSPGEKIFILSNQGKLRSTTEPSVGAYLVKEIGWYQTILVPKDTRPTTIPNGYFLGASTINITRQKARVIIAHIRVRYDDAEAIPAMTEEIEAYLRNHINIITHSKPVRVHLRDIRDDHLSIRVEAHSNITNKDEFLPVQQEVLLGIFKIVKSHSSGPAWPVLNTVAEDGRPWDRGLGDISGRYGTLGTQDYDLVTRQL